MSGDPDSDGNRLVEIHSALCACGGGCRFLPEEAGDGSSPCRAAGEDPDHSVLIPRADWERLGRPATSEAYAVAMRYSGERRRSPRFRIAIRVRLRREPAGDEGEEETVTEDIGEGGAMVATLRRFERGEYLRVTESSGLFSTQAQVQSVFVGDDDRLRVCLQFLDTNVPQRVREILCRRAEGDHDSQDTAPRR